MAISEAVGQRAFAQAPRGAWDFVVLRASAPRAPLDFPDGPKSKHKELNPITVARVTVNTIISYYITLAA
jgi:hypothetical protein